MIVIFVSFDIFACLMACPKHPRPGPTDHSFGGLCFNRVIVRDLLNGLMLKYFVMSFCKHRLTKTSRYLHVRDESEAQAVAMRSLNRITL